MDTSARDIVFDANGVCSYCTELLERTAHGVRAEGASDVARDRLVQSIKSAGSGKRYDCVVGLSGGVDSSWALVQAVRLGLRPLAVHMDNGWNSELAQNNIERLIQGLGVDLYTHVIEWAEYRALMQAFFDADVIDVELLYDNAMLAVNYRQAAANGVRYILAGSNQSTEGMHMPSNWNWYKFDKRNIRSLARGANVRLQSFPAIGTLGYVWYEHVRHIRWVPFLDYVSYVKAEAQATLVREYGYKPYPYKHYESMFTRFYQGYLLPEKFRVDKRRVHLSSLVTSGQMDRTAALAHFDASPYPTADDLARDTAYFLKKMGWTRAQLADYLRRPERPHSDLGTEKPLWDLLSAAYIRLRRARRRFA